LAHVVHYGHKHGEILGRGLAWAVVQVHKAS
jgi:hypothetical protein